MNYEENYYIIDTDIGDDIDDAMALGMALQIKGLNIIGITTVFKNTELRARLAKKLVIEMGKGHIPVYAGSGNGLVSQYNMEEVFCQYSEDLLKSEYAYNQTVCADEFIIQSAQKYGEKLRIIAIGPLTNIALAILKRPKIMSKIGGICSMGGAFYRHCNEWNIKCDPEAADIVWRSSIPKKFAGLDVTLQTQFTEQELKRALDCTSQIGKFIAELIEKWYLISNALPYMHDQLAIYTALYEMDECICGDVLRYIHAEIQVETQGITRGTTFNVAADQWYQANEGKPNCMIATYVDSEKLKTFYFNLIEGNH